MTAALQDSKTAEPHFSQPSASNLYPLSPFRLQHRNTARPQNQFVAAPNNFAFQGFGPTSLNPHPSAPELAQNTTVRRGLEALRGRRRERAGPLRRREAARWSRRKVHGVLGLLGAGSLRWRVFPRCRERLREAGGTRVAPVPRDATGAGALDVALRVSTRGQAGEAD